MTDVDRELTGLAPALRWRTWMRRVEAVLFASASPVPRADLARVVGQGASVDLLIEDLQADLADRPYTVSAVAGRWIMRTRPAFASVIQMVADVGGRIWICVSSMSRCWPLLPITNQLRARGCATSLAKTLAVI